MVDHDSGEAYGSETRDDFVFLPQEIDLEGTVTVVSKEKAYQIARVMLSSDDDFSHLGSFTSSFRELRILSIRNPTVKLAVYITESTLQLTP